MKVIGVAKSGKALQNFLRVIRIVGENYLQRVILGKSRQSMLKRFKYVFFKIFVHGAEFSGYFGQQFVEQDKFILVHGVDYFMRILAPFHKMRDDYIMRISVFFARYQFLEKRKVVVKNIQIYRGFSVKTSGNRVVYDFFMRA